MASRVEPAEARGRTLDGRAARRAAGPSPAVAFRNLIASRVRPGSWARSSSSATLIVVVGSSLDAGLHRLAACARRSRAASGAPAGLPDALQEGTLELFGGNMRGEPQPEPRRGLRGAAEAVAKVPNVKQVVPMGIDQRHRHHRATRSTSRSSSSATTAAPRGGRGPAGAPAQLRGAQERTCDAWSGSSTRRAGHARRTRAARGRGSRPGGRGAAARAIRRLLGGLRQGPLARPRVPGEPGGAAGARDRTWFPSATSGPTRTPSPGPSTLAEIVKGEPIPRASAAVLVGEAVRRGVAEAQERAAPRQDQGRARPARERIAEDQELQRWVRENRAGSARSSSSSIPRRAEAARGLLRPELGAPEGEGA